MTEEQEREVAALFVAAQTGDSGAYARCLEALAGLMRRYVRARAGDVPWVDDAVQEALLSIHQGRHTYDRSRPFAPWFYAIAHRRFIDVWRREHRRRSRETDWEGVREPSAHAPVELPFDADALRAAVRRLPARQRDVVSGLKLEGESVRELSARFGLSEGTIKITAHRGYRALRRLLGDRES